MTDHRAIQAADDMFSAAFGWRPGGSEPAQPEDTITTTLCSCGAAGFHTCTAGERHRGNREHTITHARARLIELSKLPRPQLARMHVANGGQMGLATYLKWRKDELINAILEDEGLDPWA